MQWALNNVIRRRNTQSHTIGVPHSLQVGFEAYRWRCTGLMSNTIISYQIKSN